jgi:hypothetical protein
VTTKRTGIILARTGIDLHRILLGAMVIINTNSQVGVNEMLADTDIPATGLITKESPT